MGQMTFLACYLLSHLNLERASSPSEPALVDRAPCWRFWEPDFQWNQEGPSQELGDQRRGGAVKKWMACC